MFTNKEFKNYLGQVDYCLETLSLEDLHSCIYLISSEIDLLRQNVHHSELELDALNTLSNVQQRVLTLIKGNNYDN